MRYLAPAWALALLVACACAWAGEAITLYDADGNTVAPSHLENVDVDYTCGACHDMVESARTVHFNRGMDGVDPAAGDCLSCHLGDPATAFNKAGEIINTPARPDDKACLSCHADVEEWASTRSHQAHVAMDCVDCHRAAGHQDLAPPTCEGCHTRKTDAPIAKHAGFTSLHMSRISCAGCHITSQTASKLRPGYVLTEGKIAPTNETGDLLHHGVAHSSECLGSGGCADCHSAKSPFFFGKTTLTDDGGATKTVPNHRSMGYVRTELLVGAWRERLVKPAAGWLFVAVLALSLGHYALFGPRRVKHDAQDANMVRFTLFERSMHWLAMGSFVFLSLTGMMFLFHSESPGSGLRALHGRAGLVFVLALAGVVICWWRNALFVKCDKDWVCKLGGYLWVKGDCPAGKFNAGQKLFFWLVAVGGGAAICSTGIALLLSRGDSASWVFTLHDIAAIVLMCGVLGHAYLGLFANPGTVHSILSGRVKKSWAEHHHPNWSPRETGGDAPDTGTDR